MISNNWQAIRDHYALLMPEIMDSKPWGYGIGAYEWDGKDMIYMTPIEWAMWQDIRCTGLVMYPQFPVAGFFVDFGNPVAKVAIECDGAMWHDPVLDAKRDEILQKHGWRVYRMTGRDCNKIGGEDEDGHCTPSPAEALCMEIGERHKMISRFADKDDSISEWVDMREACKLMLETLHERIARAKYLGIR